MVKDILSISGHGGLFKYLKKSRNGIIVEHLETGKRMNADATSRVNALEDISVYTVDDDIPLKDVFKTISEKEEGGPSLNPKKASSSELREYFEEIVPEYDDERVYVSDIKKILKWYNTLQKLDMLNIEEEEEETENNSEDNSEEQSGPEATSENDDSSSQPEEE
ncbi:MAG: DUF5606 domain-containing protein [Bacteroidota bacterium]